MRPHLSTSAWITLPNSAGVPPWISMPDAVSRARTSSCFSAR
jgi:hypothetical protein